METTQIEKEIVLKVENKRTPYQTYMRLRQKALALDMSESDEEREELEEQIFNKFLEANYTKI